MKEKILEALKTKYKTLGFSDKAFNGVADFLAKTVTDEATIETSIGGVEELLKTFQGETDRLRNEVSELKKKKEEKPKSEPKPETEDNKPLTLADIQKMLDERDNRTKAEKEFESRKSSVVSKLEKKGLKPSILKKLAAQISDNTLSEEDILSNVETEYNEIASELTPEAGRPTGGGGSSSASSEVDDFLAEKKALREKTKTN